VFSYFAKVQFTSYFNVSEKKKKIAKRRERGRKMEGRFDINLQNGHNATTIGALNLVTTLTHT
jgi:hypothetical protein